MMEIQNKNIVYKVQRHWFMFVQPAIIVVGGYIVLWILMREAVPLSPRVGIVFSYIVYSLYLAVPFGLYALVFMLKYWTTHIFLTKTSIVFQTGGILGSHVDELLLNKSEKINVYQEGIGRIFNFGTVTITTAGRVARTCKFISDPMKLREKINEQITNLYTNQ